MVLKFCCGFFLLFVSACQGGSLLFNAGPEYGDKTFPYRRDDYAEKVVLPKPLQFYDQAWDTIYIDINGVIWLGWYCKLCTIPQSYPIRPPYQSISCFWGNVDLTKTGNIYFRIKSMQNSQKDWKFSLNTLSLYNNRLQLNPTNMTMIIIVTWKDVTFSGAGPGAPTNTFQCVIVSDQNNTFVIRSYEKLTWTNGIWEGANSTGLGGIPAAAGVDTSKNDSSKKFDLPGSNTGNILQLVSLTNLGRNKNFYRAPPGNGGAMMQVVKTQTPSTAHFQPPENYTTSTCQAIYDPHYTTFDEEVTDNVFHSSVTAHQTYGETFLLAATVNCSKKAFTPEKTFPPFKVYMKTVHWDDDCDSDGCVTSAGTLRVEFYFGRFFGKLSSVHLHRTFRLTIEIIYNPRNGRQAATISCQGKVENDPNNSRLYSSCEDLDLIKINANGCPLCSPFKVWVEELSNPVGYRINTDFGFSAQYADTHKKQLLLTLPYGYPDSSLTGNIVGQCGNFDQKKGNDVFCPTSGSVDGETWRKCWKEYNPSGPTNDLYFTAPGICGGDKIVQSVKGWKESPPSEQLLYAQRICGMMNDTQGAFQDCSSVATKDFVISSCIWDVDATNGDPATICSYFEHFAQLCLANGNTVKPWRNATFCPPTCTSGKTYKDRMTACPATCDNPLAEKLCLQPQTQGCACPDGHFYKGDACILPSECDGCFSDTGNFILINGYYITTDCAQNCTCHESGPSCSTLRCTDHAFCVSGPSGGQCVCDSKNGWHGNGFTTCSTHDYCKSSPCKNNATCHSEPARSTFACTCTQGFTGKQCETRIDYCSLDNPCNQGTGTCHNMPQGPVCTCSEGYMGKYCAIKINHCASYPCKNLATCNNTNTGYVCQCLQGFTGAQCQTEINYCANFTCLNGGSCINHHTGPTCNCVLPFTGTRCQTKIDWCASSPCQHGTCFTHPTGYTCHCDAGYTGTNCEQRINFCQNVTCRNGGTCINQLTGFLCICAQDYTGKYCQQFVTTTTEKFTPPPACDFFCTGKPNGAYSMPCVVCSHQYYYCYHGRKYLQSCGKQYFDPQSKQCTLTCHQ